MTHCGILVQVNQEVTVMLVQGIFSTRNADFIVQEEQKQVEFCGSFVVQLIR